jgi:hypothetical protein
VTEPVVDGLEAIDVEEQESDQPRTVFSAREGYLPPIRGPYARGGTLGVVARALRYGAMQVPAFLARQFYVNGSLRNTSAGFQLEAQNPLGNGTLVGIGKISVDGRLIAKESVTARKQGTDADLRAGDVSRVNPIRVQKGDRVTLSVTGEKLAPGDHILEVELFEVNLGALRFTLSDRLAE